PPEGDTLAYVIFTSGSTGRPRGVMVTQAALAARVQSMVEAYGVDGQDRVLQFISPGFDAAAEEIFPALVSGATLVMHADPTALAPAEFLAEFRRLRLTSLHLPAAYWHPLADHVLRADEPLPGSLRTTLVGGESLNPERAAGWRRRLPPGGRLFNVYGPTEATITATVEEMAASPEPESRARVPIGRPLAGTDAYVLDAGLEPVPAGAPG